VKKQENNFLYNNGSIAFDTAVFVLIFICYSAFVVSSSAKIDESKVYSKIFEPSLLRNRHRRKNRLLLRNRLFRLLRRVSLQLSVQPLQIRLRQQAVPQHWTALLHSLIKTAVFRQE